MIAKDKRYAIGADIDTYQRLRNLARRTERSMGRMLRVIVLDYERCYLGGPEPLALGEQMPNPSATPQAEEEVAHG